jgi:DNA-binding transcriptional LysR family regulator
LLGGLYQWLVEIVRTLARKSELSGAIRADGAFKDVKPKGTLLVEVQGTLARHFLMPSLFEFFARYPEIELSMSESDRWVDLVREGVDCVLRFGNLPDSDMVARRVGMLSGMTCAAPAYVERFGVPQDLESLAPHPMVGIRSLTTGQLRQLDFTVGGNVRHVAVKSTLSVTGPESYLAGGRLGLGLVQVPRFHVQNDLNRGSMLQILRDWPPPMVPVSLPYPHNRQLSPRVRVFLDWAAREFAARNV